MPQTPLRIIEGSSGQREELLSEELDLILAAQHDDSSAFQKLYDHYRDRIYNVVYYSLDDAQQVDDALQTVFVKAFQALPSFRLESSLLTWLYRIAINECKNRKRRPRLFVPIRNIQDGLQERDPSPGPDDVHASGQRAQIVRRAVMSLKPKYRCVVVLKYLEEMSYEDIAETLGCSPGTVASRLSRALEILGEKLPRW